MVAVKRTIHGTCLATDSVWARNWSQVRKSKTDLGGLPLPSRVGVRDVPDVQMERRVLAKDQTVVGQRVVADALVAEGREGEGLRIRRRGGEGADTCPARRGTAGSKPSWPTPSSFVQPGRRRVSAGVQVVLGVVAARADTGQHEG